MSIEIPKDQVFWGDTLNKMALNTTIKSANV